MQECSHALPGPAPSSMLCTLAADAGMWRSQGNWEPPMGHSQPPPLCSPGWRGFVGWGNAVCMQTKPGAQMALGNCSMTSKGGLPGPQEGCLTPACTSTAEFHLLSRPAPAVTVTVSWTASFVQTFVELVWWARWYLVKGCLFHP